MLKKLWLVYWLVLTVYAVFSYSLTDPNLVITSWPPYWNFQQWMWRTFFDQAPTLSWTYAILVTILLAIFGLLLLALNQQPVTRKPSTQIAFFWLMLAVCLPLLFSYNALSHDVFNYMFNAKMVRVYQANPHVKVALDFSHDDWLRFMHNTHTPAPYGYGWTGLSLLPSTLGVDKFVPTWLAFRVMSLVSLGLLFWVLVKGSHFLTTPLTSTQLALFFAHPLVLLEIVSNSHNDLWMMIPAVASLILVASPDRSRLPTWVTLASSLLLLSLSVSIKFASLALVPLWLLLAFNQWRPLLGRWQAYWPVLASLAMFLPLLTERSQQFHPWYLTWVLVWLPLFKVGKISWFNQVQIAWSGWILALSVSSLYRYLPWMWAGGFAGDVWQQQKMVTWLGAVLIWVVGMGMWAATRRGQSNTLQ